MRLFLALILAIWGGAALAEGPEACPKYLAGAAPRVIPAALAEDQLGLTFMGHSTFLLRTHDGLRIATDYNDYISVRPLPDIVTMNRAHDTHYTDHPDPRIGSVLRGWNPGGGLAAHDVTIGDVRIRNVVTNLRDGAGGTDYDANSIFVFEAAQLCVAHLGHLHHELTPEHLRQLGQIDVVLVPVDGSFTLDVKGMLDNVAAIGAPLIIPMHYFNRRTLDRFLSLARERWPVEYSQTPDIVLSRTALPRRPKVLVLPGN